MGPCFVEGSYAHKVLFHRPCGLLADRGLANAAVSAVLADLADQVAHEHWDAQQDPTKRAGSVNLDRDPNFSAFLPEGLWSQSRSPCAASGAGPQRRPCTQFDGSWPMVRLCMWEHVYDVHVFTDNPWHACQTP